MSDDRPDDQPFSPMTWIRDVRIGPGLLVAILAVLGAIWAVFHFTDLWYVLFP